jgi:hypothetical protein
MVLEFLWIGLRLGETVLEVFDENSRGPAFAL